MRIKILNLLICCFLSSCELIQQEQNQPVQTIKKEEVPVNPNENFMKIDTPLQESIKPTTQAIKVGQNPSKSFHDIGPNVTQGNAKHSFPTEDLLK